jgi:hypothetical protein
MAKVRSVSTPLSLARPLILMTAMTLSFPASVISTGSNLKSSNVSSQSCTYPRMASSP